MKQRWVTFSGYFFVFGYFLLLCSSTLIGCGSGSSQLPRAATPSTTLFVSLEPVDGKLTRALPRVSSFVGAQFGASWVIIGGSKPNGAPSEEIFIITPEALTPAGAPSNTDFAVTSFPLHQLDASLAPVVEQLRGNDLQGVLDGERFLIFGGKSAAGEQLPVVTAIHLAGFVDSVLRGRNPSTSIRYSTDDRFAYSGGGAANFEDGTIVLAAGFPLGEIRRFRLNDLSIIEESFSSWSDPAFARIEANVHRIVEPSGNLGVVIRGGLFGDGAAGPLPPIYIGNSSAPSVDNSFTPLLSSPTTANILLSDGVNMYSVGVGGIQTVIYDYTAKSFTAAPEPVWVKYLSSFVRSGDGHSFDIVQDSVLPDFIGRSGQFFPNPNIPRIYRDIVDSRQIPRRALIGYVFGGVRANGSGNETPVSSSSTELSKTVYRVYVEGNFEDPV